MKNYVFKLLKKYDYDWNKIYQAIKDKEFVADEEVVEYDDYENFISILDPEYVDVLKWLPKPPFVIFHKGNLRNLEVDKNTKLIPSFKEGARELEKELIKKGEKVIMVHACGRNDDDWKKDNKKSLGITLYLDDEVKNKKWEKQTLEFCDDLQRVALSVKNCDLGHTNEPITNKQPSKKKDRELIN